MNRERAEYLVAARLRKLVQRERIHTALLMTHSDLVDIHLSMADGTADGMLPSPFQPYYIASIGKLFTSVMIMILSEHGLLSPEDPISRYLDDELMNGLHVYKGRDYSRDIKIKHLLNHTSGLHDYFGDKPKHGKKMIDLLLGQPSRRWTPREVIEWSKTNLQSHYPPGKKFHYSDTGYHLLGLIIENVISKPFHEALSVHIFRPLGMFHSCLWKHSEPDSKSEHPMARLFVGDRDVTDYDSLSADYAGGGIVSTLDDLLKFMQALVHNRLIRNHTFDCMKDWAKFYLGIDYGYGMMNIHTVPAFMPRKYNSWGNAGSVGSFMFYFPHIDLHLIGTLNKFGYQRKAFTLMLKCVDIFSTYAG